MFKRSQAATQLSGRVIYQMLDDSKLPSGYLT